MATTESAQLAHLSTEKTEKTVEIHSSSLIQKDQSTSPIPLQNDSESRPELSYQPPETASLSFPDSQLPLQDSSDSNNTILTTLTRPNTPPVDSPKAALPMESHTKPNPPCHPTRYEWDKENWDPSLKVFSTDVKRQKKRVKRAPLAELKCTEPIKIVQVDSLLVVNYC